MNTKYIITFIWLLFGTCSLYSINATLNDTLFLTGKVASFDGRSIENAVVAIVEENGKSNYTYTDSTGYYKLPVEKGRNYRLAIHGNTPTSDKMIGVSTLDLMLAANYLRGKPSVDFSAKLLAGDIDNSGHLTAYDLVLMRQLILGTISILPGQALPWVYFNKNHKFSNPNKPFSVNNPKNTLPTVVSMIDIQASRQIDWVGYKLGDIDGSFKMNSLESISATNDAEKFKLTTPVKVLEKEQLQIIPFRLPQSDILSGIQFTLEFNPELLNFIRLLPSEGIGEHNFNLNKVKEGYITFSANDFNLDEEGTLFELIVAARQKVNLTAVIAINSALTTSEVYDKKMIPFPLGM